MNVGFSMKQVSAQLFFDTKKVIDSVDKATRQVLSKAGAFVRRRARSSIRKRKKPSAPGSPPSSHVGRLKRGILFSYDPDAQSVIIGPRIDNASRGSGGSKLVPQLLEEGGTGTIRTRVRKNDGSREIKRVSVTIKKRPFMGPALEAEKKNFPKLWANSVR